MSSRSSRNPDPRWTYDVYLSSGCADSRGSFISHLYSQLADAGFYVYAEEAALRGEEEISSSVVHAIQVSRISIVVISRLYADSILCLREVEKIMECVRTKGQVVVPVYFCLDPSQVRKPAATFGKAFKRHMERFPEEEVNAWRAALTDAANHSGFDLHGFRGEAKAIENIVQHVTSLLHSTN